MAGEAHHGNSEVLEVGAKWTVAKGAHDRPVTGRAEASAEASHA